MPITSIRRTCGLAFVLCSVSLTGCYNMNGYMLNASGMSLYEQGHYARAAQEFQTAVANNPQNPDYLSNLAKSRMKLGDAAGSEQLFRQALVISPSHQPSYHGLAELMLAQGRGNEAGQMLQTWAATQPYVAESHVELAWLQRELGQHDAAAQSLQAALQANPDHPTALAHLGQYYQDRGQTVQAMNLYQQSLQSDWNQPHVHSRLAAVSQSAGAQHPMNQIAMARGVHPHSLPRQQMAMGSIAPAGMMPGGQPGPMMAGTSNMPMPPGGYGAMNDATMIGQNPAAMNSAMMPPIPTMPNSGLMAGLPTFPDGQPSHAWSPSPQIMTQPRQPQMTGMTTGFPAVMGGFSAAGGTITESPSSGASAVPAPQPDPAFLQLPPAPSISETGTPAVGVSSSTDLPAEPVIELEPF